MSRHVRIVHGPTGELLAEGPIGWGITPFEGNYYIRRKHLHASFKVNFIPGLCIYKFLYVWLDLFLASGQRLRSFGWMYVLPNPLFPFIWFRVAFPASHPELSITISEQQETETGAP